MLKYLTVICLIFEVTTLSGSICLNMIVKDEAPVIKRCLESVKPLIDYWVIVDTGSTDGTQDIILEFMKDIPGELHEDFWVDFEHNRNKALSLAKNKGDYLLFIDADEKLLLPHPFVKPNLDKDGYYLTTEYDGTKYKRLQLIKGSLNWKWDGKIHEVLTSPQAKNIGTLLGFTNLVSTEGNRAKDPSRFLKDAQLLEKALLENPTNARTVFYLAQSYRDAGEHKKALEAYQKRVSMGGWGEEVFWSLLQIGLLQENLGENKQTIEESYLKAYEFRPTRAEPLYRLANLYRRNEDYPLGYACAAKGLTLQNSKDILFVENWIYQYGLLMEFSICAYWTEKYREAFLASKLILSQENVPRNFRECAEKNLVWINQN